MFENLSVFTQFHVINFNDPEIAMSLWVKVKESAYNDADFDLAIPFNAICIDGPMVGKRVHIAPNTSVR